MAGLSIAVVVPSHDRALRLRWLLNALEEQTLERGTWEVVVVHDTDYGDLLDEHPLAADGTLRALRVGPCGPAAKRNAGWRAARAPVIAFTDDDCRPPPDWLERALAAAHRRPGAIVQGATRPDPDEAALLRAPHPRTVVVDPPTPHAQTCNIVYPRTVLERLGGFDEHALPLIGGEDADLAWRAVEAGVPYEGDPGVVTFHMVETMTLARRAAFGWRWRQLPALVRRHPGLRRHAALGVFWKPRHGWFCLALIGLVAAAAGARGRRAAAVALALPWTRAAAPLYGPGPRGRLRSALELPGQAVVDAVEIAALASGSVRHRTLFL